MSRIGKIPVKLPKEVKIEISGKKVIITGPKGTLTRKLPVGISVKEKDSTLVVIPKGKDKKSRALHGTFRALFANDVQGVTEGFSKTLELVGTGYRAELNGKTLIITVGYSHPVNFELTQGIEFVVEKTKITISGIDKELVGQVAADIRSTRPPEPYKGKGIKYSDEEIRRKPGKAAKAQGVGA